MTSTRHTASAARTSDGTIKSACQEDAPPVVRHLASHLVDILMIYPDVDDLVLDVEVKP